jgi:hypothetical protein
MAKNKARPASKDAETRILSGRRRRAAVMERIIAGIYGWEIVGSEIVEASAVAPRR